MGRRSDCEGVEKIEKDGEFFREKSEEEQKIDYKEYQPNPLNHVEMAWCLFLILPDQKVPFTSFLAPFSVLSLKMK